MTVTAADDRRHVPGAAAKPLWNESWWFPFYDPASRIGVVTRIGLLPLQNLANVWMLITRDGTMLHDATSLARPVPAGDIDGGVTVGGVTYRCTEPLRRWRLTYEAPEVGIDVEWTAFSPAHPWPVPQGVPVEDMQRHLEQSGWVSGQVRVGTERVAITRAFGHRDHSWGGERDWTRLNRWYYVSGEFGDDLSFNAVKVWLAPETFITIGCLWDGTDAMDAASLDVEGTHDPATDDHTAVRVALRDARGRDWSISGRVLAHGPVQIGPTRVDDAITEFRCGDRIGYGIVEYGSQR